MAERKDQNRHPGDLARIRFFAHWDGKWETFNKNSLHATKHGEKAARGETKMKMMIEKRPIG